MTSTNTTDNANLILVDGQLKSRLNSLGDLIDETDDGLRAFWAWFKDSQVLDDFQRPLVVFHGTANEQWRTGEMRQFHDKNGMGEGCYFTPLLALAEDYAERDSEVEGDYPFVIPVYLVAKNPLVHRDGMQSQSIRSDQRAVLETKGIDCVIGASDATGIAEIAVFSPLQIKSIANRTRWVSDDPRLLSVADGADPRFEVFAQPISANRTDFASLPPMETMPSLDEIRLESARNKSALRKAFGSSIPPSAAIHSDEAQMIAEDALPIDNAPEVFCQDYIWSRQTISSWALSEIFAQNTADSPGDQFNKASDLDRTRLPVISYGDGDENVARIWGGEHKLREATRSRERTIEVVMGLKKTTLRHYCETETDFEMARKYGCVQKKSRSPRP